MVSLVVEVPTVPLRTDEHGVLRVGDTRVRFDTVITAWKQGESPEQIVENFDVLDLADVYAVISYYLNHREEVEAYLERSRDEANRVRADMEKRFPQAGIRERLLARHTIGQSEARSS